MKHNAEAASRRVELLGLGYQVGAGMIRGRPVGQVGTCSTSGDTSSSVTAGAVGRVRNCRW
jgi:hypothetical protein